MRKSLWVRTAIVASITAAVAGSSLVAYGYVFGFDGPTPHPAAANGNGSSTTSATTVAEPSTTSSEITTTTIPTTTTTHPPMKNLSPSVMPDVSNFGLAIGARGPAVLTYKQRLHDLHFDPGPIDQNFGQDLTYAIQAVQKLYGLPRSGRIDAITRIAISNFKFPKPLVKNGEADRVEIDLDRQVLVLWKNYQIILITTASTGSGEHFCGGADGCQYAVTPPGKFHLQYHFNGWKEGKLGKMWNPYFFNGGIAIHGLASVPPYPASHGCTRIPMDIATYFASLVSKDEAVYVVGAPSHTGPNPPPTVPPATTSSTSTSTTVPGTTTTVPRTTTTHPATTSTHPATTTTAPAPTTTT